MLNNLNNNIELAGKYKIIWWKQEANSVRNYRRFLSRLGFSSEGSLNIVRGFILEISGNISLLKMDFVHFCFLV